MFPIHLNQALQECLLFVLCVAKCCGWVSLAFSPVGCNGPLCLLWAEFCPFANKGPVLVFHGLAVVWDQMPALMLLARSVVVPNCKALSLQHPLRDFCWWMDLKVRWETCPQSIWPGCRHTDCQNTLSTQPVTNFGCWDCTQAGVYYLPFSSGQKWFWSCTIPCWCCLEDERGQELLWRDCYLVGQSGWCRYIRECGGRVHNVSKLNGSCSHWFLHQLSRPGRGGENQHLQPLCSWRNLEVWSLPPQHKLWD